jgi:hypothetical protein
LAAFKARVYKFYDSWSWDGKTRVFNPFSLINFLSDQTLGPFWYTSGTLAFLTDLIRESPAELSLADVCPVSGSYLEAADTGELQLVPLIFQTGYLTAGKRIGRDNRRLRGSDQEVNAALNSSIIKGLTDHIRRTYWLLGVSFVRPSMISTLQL